VAVNDYEGRVLQEKTGKSVRLSRVVKAFIVTQGAEGSLICMMEKTRIPVCSQAVLDLRARGRYRAGLLYGHLGSLRLAHYGRLASLWRRENRQPWRAEPSGDPRHDPRYREAFGTSIW
jgi:hypothetical protein